MNAITWTLLSGVCQLSTLKSLHNAMCQLCWTGSWTCSVLRTAADFYFCKPNWTGAQWSSLVPSLKWTRTFFFSFLTTQLEVSLFDSSKFHRKTTVGGSSATAVSPPQTCKQVQSFAQITQTGNSARTFSHSENWGNKTNIGKFRDTEQGRQHIVPFVSLSLFTRHIQ